ncbi:hypothetical protein V1517DRAFT_319383 [Lipomyces orientalis]|uniref:Uncharacterized protein n=1 Tax=Lipomyces orientalis TaxID=1233043 RepID=A0ACC3TRM0_9ASCO
MDKILYTTSTCRINLFQRARHQTLFVPGSHVGVFKPEALTAFWSKKCIIFNGNVYCIYGDPAYGVRACIIGPYKGAALTPQQQAFYTAMSSVLQCVKWQFGPIFQNSRSWITRRI